MDYRFARFQNTVCNFVENNGVHTMYCVKWKMTILFLTYRFKIVILYILYLIIILYFALIYIYLIYYLFSN